MLAPDTLINGRYKVIRAIGKGGMGAVYEAFDQRLHSPVALKQMIVEGDQLSRAFAREAQLLASLRHQALPRVIDHFVDDQGQFLVMEFIPGDDLATLLARRDSPFPVEQALAWADTLLDALSYLHSQQPPVIHRDIKPQNMKLTPRGEIILLDFGLAKGAVAHSQSITGSVFGYTPQYAPLEQIKGSGTEPRSDLYALAATIYNLITGTPPPDALTRAAATITREPDPLQPAHIANPSVPQDVSAILMQALSLAPAARFASAVAMRRALQSTRHPPAAHPQVEATVVAGRPMVAPDIRPPSIPQAGPPVADRTTLPSQETMPASVPGSLPAPPPLPAAAPAQRRGPGVCGVLGIITLVVAIAAVVGITLAVRRIGQEVSQGIDQVLERVTEAAPTFIAAQQTLEAVSTQTVGNVSEQATVLAPTLAAAQQTAVTLATSVASDAPLPPGQPRPINTVPYRIGELITGEIRARNTRLGYVFTIEEPQQIFVETREYAQGMQQVGLELVAPGGGRVFRSCLGCGNPGVHFLRSRGEYVLIVSGSENAGAGAFRLQIYDVPPPERFTITLDAGIGAGRPEPGAGQIVSPGARQEYVFEAQAGQQVFVVTRRRDQALSQVRVRLLDPIGGEIFSTCLGCGNPGAFVLQRAGTYTLVVGSEREPSIGTYELGVYNVPPPREFVIGLDAIIAGDQPGPGAGRIDTPGARNEYRFEAQAGQQVAITVVRRDAAVTQLMLILLAPSGAEVYSRCLGCGDPGVLTLPESGGYRLIIGSNKDEGVGRFEVRLAPVR
ncbi:MAG: serine/threonine protein kinase [Chloroflexi bacterium]|nr:serine/threonine protein kinase [Chloroflexota bacterium]